MGLDTLLCGADLVAVFVEEVVCLWFFGFLFGCFSIQSTVLMTCGCCSVDNSSSQVS